MLKMTLCNEKRTLKILTENNNVEYSDKIQLYQLFTSAENTNWINIGYGIFSVDFENFDMDILKVIYNKKDKQIFDFIMKGILGFGEQHSILNVNFKNKEDVNEMVLFKFIPDKNTFSVKLYEIMNNCKNCKNC